MADLHADGFFEDLRHDVIRLPTPVEPHLGGFFERMMSATDLNGASARET